MSINDGPFTAVVPKSDPYNDFRGDVPTHIEKLLAGIWEELVAIKLILERLEDRG